MTWSSLRPSVKRLLSIDHAVGATIWFTVLGFALNWPVIARAAVDVTSDFGDPLLNAWILGWNAEWWMRVLSGDFAAFGQYWHANIYHPHPYALAYSEHLFAQGLQILPIYALTGNIILCYNLSFLSTHILSGLGTYLLVRELTGSPRSAFVAGLIYAFVPYRIAQIPHVQVLASQWMPFVLFGFRRYFVTRRLVPLAGAIVALIAQNLSCGYYLLYFAPFVALYVLYEMLDRKLLLNVRVWLEIAAAAVVVVSVTLPFLLPYQALRSLGNTERHIAEVRSFSADVFGYLTTADDNRLWGGIIKVFVKSEGELFPSFTAMALAAFCVVTLARGRWAEAAAAPAPPRWARIVVRVLWVLLATQLLAMTLILLGLGGIYRLGPLALSIRGFPRAASLAIPALALLIALSPRLRAMLRGTPGSAAGFFVGAMVLAWFLSLGPEITAMGRPVAPGLYQLLYDYVPGYDGLRVPARFGMIVMVFLAVLAGYALRHLELRSPRGPALVLALGGVFLLESIPAPVPMNRGWEEDGLAAAPARVHTGDSVPAVYKYVRRLPAGSAIAEFPFGATGYELLAVYYASQHWKPIVNGYSGGSPPAYHERAAILSKPLREPQLAWTTLLASQATHVVVHDWAYPQEEATALNAWLASSGAAEVATFSGDRVYRLPRRATAPATSPAVLR